MSNKYEFLKEKETAPKIKLDDLVYSGKYLVIPSYWAESIHDYLIDFSNVPKNDQEDFNNFREFLRAVIDSKASGN